MNGGTSTVWISIRKLERAISGLFWAITALAFMLAPSRTSRHQIEIATRAPVQSDVVGVLRDDRRELKRTLLLTSVLTDV